MAIDQSFSITSAGTKRKLSQTLSNFRNEEENQLRQKCDENTVAVPAKRNFNLGFSFDGHNENNETSFQGAQFSNCTFNF